MNIKISIDSKELLNATKKEPIIALQEINNAIKKSSIKIQSIAQRIAPADTGKLRQMIETRLEPLKGTVESKAKYSLYVHEGTRPHVILPKNIGYPGHKGGLGSVRKGFGVFNKVNHPGTSPNPFMTNAINKAIPYITKYFSQAADNILKKI
jgi:hypothetical protein